MPRFRYQVRETTTRVIKGTLSAGGILDAQAMAKTHNAAGIGKEEVLEVITRRVIVFCKPIDNTPETKEE